jgi:4-amino-4-deoxy-L-arabinose transferase-like glycosyltransferase
VTRSLKRAALCWLALALALSAAALLASRLAGPRGLRLADASIPGGPAASARRVATVDLRDLRVDPAFTYARRVTWDGYWHVPADGRYKLIAEGAGPIAVSVDGQPVLAGDGGGRLRGRVQVASGLHELSVTYALPNVPDRLRLRWARDETPLRDFGPGSVFARPPSAAEMAWARAAPVLAILARAVWALGLVGLIALAALGRLPEGARRALRVALPALVVLYAAALRFDALVGRHSWAGPPWAIEAQRMIESWRPGDPYWRPEYEISSGDPYHYVTRGRAMRGFYDPDVREPLFPAWTRVFLALLDDRVLAVHVASAACSTLLVLATYLLGAAAFSRAVGLIAATALAVDRDMLWWSVEGFRDDAFALLVVVSALALVRLMRRPTTWTGVLAGLAGGAACLTRLTSLSFLLPAAALLLVFRGADAHDRRRALGVAGLVLVALVGPFLASCAIAYGDAFYSVNFHTKFYRSRSGLSFQDSMGWIDYLRAGSPLREQAAIGLEGVTTYPFRNKWHGLDYVAPWLPRPLALAGLAGLLLFLRSREGRLLLVVLLTSLLPYAFTWRILGGAEWRFTMHAYPFYLVAAGLAITSVADGLRRALRRPDAGV